MKAVWWCVYWPVAAVTALCWVMSGATLALHQYVCKKRGIHD